MVDAATTGQSTARVFSYSVVNGASAPALDVVRADPKVRELAVAVRVALLSAQSATVVFVGRLFAYIAFIALVGMTGTMHA